MAIYTNLEAVDMQKHGIFESSNLKSTDVGNIYDVLVMDKEGEGAKPIDVDNGVAVKVGEYTGNGLQERYGIVAAKGDMIAVTGSPAVIKDAFTKAQRAITNFYHKAGQLAKTYEVLANDIFAIGDYQFTEASASAVKEGAYVVVDGNGQWVAQAAKPEATTYGFIGKVHSIAQDNIEQVACVRILCVQNVQL